MNECFRMGITVPRMVISGGKPSGPWSQIAFYGSAIESL